MTGPTPAIHHHHQIGLFTKNAARRRISAHLAGGFAFSHFDAKFTVIRRHSGRNFRGTARVQVLADMAGTWPAIGAPRRAVRCKEPKWVLGVGVSTWRVVPSIVFAGAAPSIGTDQKPLVQLAGWSDVLPREEYVCLVLGGV